jgi:hypothetical protein
MDNDFNIFDLLQQNSAQYTNRNVTPVTSTHNIK